MNSVQLFLAAEKLREQMSLQAAIATYELAEAAGYDADECGAARWTCHMLTGSWQRAWEESDRIALRGGPDPHQYWDGRSWAGQEVLIRCLHGLGDTLQFIRYAALIRQEAKSLTIEAQPKLKRILSDSGLANRVMTWGEEEPDWQVQMEVNELPRIFRSDLQTIPQDVPYLKATEKPLQKRGEGCLQAGLIWAASDFDTTRNVPLEALATLMDISGVQFYSLQAGEGWTASLPGNIVSLSDADTPIEQIAAEMTALDLIVTVDTMNAHLAGALGCETWTMLPFQCDWRWMAAGNRSPWYPTMRLFRQSSRGDWGSVVEQVRAAVAERIRQG